MKTIFFFLFVFLSITACRTYAPTTLENPGCKTVISGFISCNGKWDNKVPVMFTKLEDGVRTRIGEVIEKNSEGFIFKPDREQNYGPYPKPRLFKFDEIVCLLDSNAQVIYGTFPNKYLSYWGMIWELTSYSNDDASSIYLKIGSNGYFSFCLEPDIYKVEKIIFVNEVESNYYDLSDNLPEMKIIVKADTNNYIGDIVLDNMKLDDKFYKIPCSVGDRPRILGSYGGLLSELAHQLDMSGKDVFHTLMIKDNLQSGDKRNKSIIKIIE